MQDVQGEADQRKIPIRRVGVRSVRLPCEIVEGSKKTATVAYFSMSVSLAAEKKGTHMSRFLETLYERGKTIDRKSFMEMNRFLLDRLEANTAETQIEYCYFIEKQAPITKTRSLFDVEVKMTGVSHRDSKKADSLKIVVEVPVQTLCPCSKAISEFGAHNQRSRLIMTLWDTSLSIEEIVSIAEGAASAALYPLLKREDEKYVTEYAYNNPKFVEDLVRDAARGLKESPKAKRFEVYAENFESIHNHNVWSVVESSDLESF